MNIALMPRRAGLNIAILAFIFSLIFSSVGFIQAGLVNGEFCYALDDSFIMMALSKNLAFHHVWGLTQHEFSSTASSPLFAVLLAGFIWLIGDHVWLPLVINIMALAGLYIWVADKAIKWGFNQWQIWMMLMGLFYFMPIPVLLFGSMEHIVHTWIALYCLQQVIENEEGFNGIKLFVFAALLSSIRYEGLFEGGLIVLWFWKNKNWSKGFLFGVGLAFPVFWLGIYSVLHGWFFVPNSLILKGYGMNIQETHGFFHYLFSLLMKAANHPHVVAPFLILYLLKGLKKNFENNNWLWIEFVFWTSILHFIFARYNHVYRYESYLMALGWVVIWKTVCQGLLIRNLKELKGLVFSKPIQIVFFLAIVFSPLKRSVDSFAVGTRAIVNIFDQQVQAAKFVAKYYNTAVVGAIDVGAIAYYSDCKLLDIWGLGSIEFAKLKLTEQYVPFKVDSVCRKRKMEIAIVYGKNLGHLNWKNVASWPLFNNVVCSADTIDFLAITPVSRKNLLINMKKFKLPNSISTIYYP